MRGQHEVPVGNPGQRRFRASDPGQGLSTGILRLRAVNVQTTENPEIRQNRRRKLAVETARRQAIDVLLDRRLIELEAANFDSFAAALDAPSAPGPKLKALISRKPAWEK